MKELLAPAGNLETLKIAIANGADAVYLGLEQFNARANIENFNLDNLEEGVNYAHLFGVKIYLAINILFKDDEFNQVLETIEKALHIGVDALIVQDIGLANVVRKKFPSAQLHASTQMGVSNLEGAKFLAENGFCRIVLARETSLSEIKRIKDNLDVEIEYFVQGALCVSYSGNCYLCSMLAGASGNRGKCKQFCRLPYQMNFDGITKQGYLLSAKDISMLGKLKSMAEAGVDSFKIEGRARRAGYVGECVKIYRKALDNNFTYSQQDIQDLKKSFNRGDFIEGYFSGEKIIYDKIQNHIGIPVGKILKVNKGKRFNQIYLTSTHSLQKNDCIKTLSGDKEECTISVQDVKSLGKCQFMLTSTALPSVGSEVRLIVDSSLEKHVKETVRNIPVEAYFVGKVGKKPELTLKTVDEEIKITGEQLLEEAKSSPLTFDELSDNLSRLGEEFLLTKLDAQLENVFIVKSVLNKLRRDAIALLKQAIIDKNKPNFLKNEEKVDIFDAKISKKRLLFTSLLDVISKSKGYDGYIFSPNDFDENKLENFMAENKDKQIYLSCPIMATEKEIDLIKSLLKRNPELGAYANNYYALSLTDKERTIIGANMNIFNSYSIAFFVSQGFDKIVLTNEANNLSILKNCGATLFYFSKFYPEYMNFKHCPIKEHIGGDCASCKYKEGVTFKLNNTGFNLIRRKLIFCSFVLKSTSLLERKFDNLSEIVEVN